MGQASVLWVAHQFPFSVFSMKPSSSSRFLASLKVLAGRPDACVACPNGSFPNSNQTKCVPCPAGTMGPVWDQPMLRRGDVCVPCPKGQVSSAGQTFCLVCRGSTIASVQRHCEV